MDTIVIVNWGEEFAGRRVEDDGELKLTAAELRAAYASGEMGFDGANLRYENLSGTNLSGANLSYSFLTGANLNAVNLSGANLAYASLRGARLHGANLAGANLTSADITGAIGIASVIGGGVNRDAIYAVANTSGPMFQVGDFWGGYEAAKAEVVEKYSAPEYNRYLKPMMLALDMLVALLEAQNE